MKSSRILALLVVVLWLGPTLIARQAYAQVTPHFVVRVVIESVRAADNFEGPIGGDADFYALVTIGGRELPRIGPRDNSNFIRPNWVRESMVEQVEGSVPVIIEIRDRDGRARFGDDHADITSGSGRNLNIDVDLLACTVSGEVTGDCGATLASSGRSRPRAGITFRIEVIDVSPPPTAVGLHVRCTHAPVWPQPGDVVRITAASLDGTLAPRPADAIEVWFQELTDRPRRIFANVGTGTFAFRATESGTVPYGCRVQDDGAVVFSGWRRLTVGAPAQGRAVPVLFSGPSRRGAIDILLVPDAASFPAGPTDANFLAAAGALIQNAYYNDPVFLAQQRRINFWVSQDTGMVGPAACQIVQPANFNTAYLFAEAVGIVHTTAMFIDCGGQGLFSTMVIGGVLNARTTGVARHELGHAAFGLADEYCVAGRATDCGGDPYFEVQPNPNVYDGRISLPADPMPSLQQRNQNALDRCRFDSPDPAACRLISRIDPMTGPVTIGFATSDPPDADMMPNNDDLMNDNGPARTLDRRRIDWKFGECKMDRCGDRGGGRVEP